MPIGDILNLDGTCISAWRD